MARTFGPDGSFIAHDLVGQKFGKVTVLKRDGMYKNGHAAKWLCQCECGEQVHHSTHALRTRNPGCKKCYAKRRPKILIPGNIRHGAASNGKKNLPKLYTIWMGMKQRCYDPSPKHKYWHGKGIIVCSEWQKYEGFKAWAIENGYEAGLSIDRKDPDKNYEPDNCEWVTRKEQARRISNPKCKQDKAREDRISFIYGQMGMVA